MHILDANNFLNNVCSAPSYKPGPCGGLPETVASFSAGLYCAQMFWKTHTYLLSVFLTSVPVVIGRGSVGG
jgi:hypothetical protein